MLNRRAFLATLGAATAGAALAQTPTHSATPTSDRLGTLLPQRALGKTGTSVTAFCLGGHHVEKDRTEAESQAIIEKALEMGCRFFDNAYNYGKGEAERRYGLFLSPKYRDVAFIMTKCALKTGPEASRQLDEALSRMKCDYLDLWQIHMIESPKDVDDRIRDGVLDVFLKAKESGKVKYIGFTGHVDYRAHLRMLEALASRGIDLDTCQMPINLCDPHHESFTINVLPRLVERKYGILAMKTMAYGQMTGRGGFGKEPRPAPLTTSGVTPRQMHEYVYSLPIAALVSGCTSTEEVAENTSVLRGFTGMAAAERDRLIELAEKHSGPAMERYKGKKQG
ncbi:MAG TPA: aldo/keto reductase [Verrucomicrobiae bacterium]|nr:aldo/keto reductase [Verrucomicrobiae bacterium]